jgi:hypothetical protein
MTKQHLISPPPELRNKWLDEAPITSVYDSLIDRAAEWGANQELEACCVIALDSVCGTKHQRRMLVSHIRERRRPKPPSLKERALNSLQKIENNGATYLDSSIIRCALQALPE